jgi:GAF domain-containing protein
MAAHSEQAVLEVIARLAVAVVPSSDAASCTVLDDGRPRAAGHTAGDVQAVHALWREPHGPFATAANEQATVVIDDLTAHAVESAARAEGLRSVLATALMCGDSVVGVLTLYGRKPGAFASLDQRELAPFLEQAAVTMRNARDYTAAATLNDQLRDALASRAVIEQAKGAIMAGRRISADEAFELLRRSSQRRNIKLREVAQEVVDSTRPPLPRRPNAR